jgi:hypothetical protein
MERLFYVKSVFHSEDGTSTVSSTGNRFRNGRGTKMELNPQQKQQLTGYLFVVLALFLLADSIFEIIRDQTSSAGITLLLAVFLGYLAVRQLQPGKQEKTMTADERTRRTVRYASSQAFWLLYLVTIAQTIFTFIPQDLLTSTYQITGMVALAVYWAYYRWQGVPT